VNWTENSGVAGVQELQNWGGKGMKDGYWIKVRSEWSRRAMAEIEDEGEYEDDTI
jgi:hypothetical protein